MFPHLHCPEWQAGPRRERLGRCAESQPACLFPGFLVPSYSLAHSASCCRDTQTSLQHSPALEYRQLRQEAEEDAFTGEESNAKTSPAESAAGTAPTQQQDSTRAPTAPHSHPGTRVPLGCRERAAGQECGRHRERAHANHPSGFPEDFDPPVLFKLSGRKSSWFTA